VAPWHTRTAHLRAGYPAAVETTRVKLLPWDYLFEPFSKERFPDLYNPTWIASLVLLVATVVFYNVRTRQLHRHKVYLEMYEWILWTGIIVFSLMLVYALFRFDWIIVLSTLVVGLGTFVWVRFFRFPPYFRAYERQLAKQRYFSRERFSKPEATIRTKASRRRRRR
jgi:O-antigen/teichoic acid export membrane protein